MTGHVALYCRISEDRGGRAEGVEAQERAGRSYARNYWPGVPVVVYPDNDLTAADADVWRPGYEKLRANIQAGDVAHVWAVEQSRLQRRELGWFQLAAELTAAGITEVHTNRDGIVRVADEIAGIKAVLAAAEVRKLKQRVNDRLADKAVLGEAPGSLPFGYRHEGKSYAQVPEQAQAIRDAAALVLQGWSLARIARELDSRGLRGAHGGTISATNVRKMITNATTAGLRVHRGEIVGAGNWQPILDEATWQACRARLAAPRIVEQGDGNHYPVTVSHRGSPGRKYVLSGIAVCGVCRQPMIGTLKQLRNAKGVRSVQYLQCHPSRGAHVGIMYEATEALVLAALWAQLDKPGFLDAIAADEHAARRDQITTQLSALDGRRSELAALWAAGARTSDEWGSARAALLELEQTLRAELGTVGPPPARASIDAARGSWSLMELDEQREFTRLFVEKITIMPALNRGGGSPGYDASRVVITWR